ERDSGGLIRGALAARKAAPAPPPGPRPSPFRAPRGGLGELVESLAARLQAAGVRVETNATVEAIVATPHSGFVVSRASGEALRADAVVCAAPAPVAAGLLSELDPALAKGLGTIPYASVANVSLAYPLTALPRPLVGSGYLAPRAERRPINAGTWSSAKWAGRAPEGFALLRVSFGGVGRTGVLEASDERLVEIARDELRTLLGVAKPPRFTRVFRWPTAMPQYELGHLRRVAAIETRLADHPGLALAGNALHGVGLADCVGTGDGAAARIAEFLAKHDDAGNG
ncbi:MAG: protoporphyrinogen oxidase, partial [Thermomicrobiales bacterium]|nr:protoporphyrinogen oxidase [Thermomicrobiales bacterium]